MCDGCCLRVCVCVLVRVSVGMSWAAMAMSYELVHMYPGQHINIVQTQFGSANKRYCALPPIPQLFFLAPRIQHG